ncbi:MAG: ribosome-associated translation inhibitor RaiA [Gammaproteobacteria bacterium]|nr:MAG: ribosome-associated translation inhibitor RaiA [Gammaproteobacteria bacterium]
MKPAVDVLYRDLEASPALNEIISKKLEKLNRYSDQIIHSRVVLDTPHNHKHKGKQFRASIEIDIKGHPIAVAQDNESIHVAVRDAFITAERKVKQIAARQRTLQ